MMLSAFFSYLDGRRRKSKITIFGYVAILLPCILAGLRDIGVGADSNGYGRIAFEVAKGSTSFFEYIQSRNPFVSGVEVLYRVFVYVIARIFGDIHWQFFFIQLVISFFTYKAVVDQGLKRYAWISQILFHTLFFSFSLNLMRQLMAMAIVLWALKFVQKKQWVKFIIAIAVATLLHTMAVVSALIYPLYYICISDKNVRGHRLQKFFAKHKNFINFCILIASTACVVLGSSIISALSFLKRSYSEMLTNIKGTFDFNQAALILMILFIIPFYLLREKSDKNSKEFIFYRMTLMISAIVWQLSGVVQEYYRIAMYLWIFILLAVPKLLSIFRRSNRQVVALGYVVLGCFYYVYYFVIVLANKTYPYTSEILGIK